MKKILLSLLIIGLILSSFYILNKIYYQDQVEFLSPLETENLRIRYDRFGDGHFGARRKNGHTHAGLDILSPLGTPVRAAKSGWAVTKFDKDGYGKYVRICHNSELTTLYAHLKETNVKWPGRVRQGDIIGWVGKTGNARYKGIKPHLHFEVRKNGVPQDPKKFL